MFRCQGLFVSFVIRAQSQLANCDVLSYYSLKSTVCTVYVRPDMSALVSPLCSGLLDIARRTYTELVDDIACELLNLPKSLSLGDSCIALSALVKQLAEQHQLPLKVAYNGSRGFFIQMHTSSGGSVTSDSLPSVFMKVVKARSTVSFTTEDLVTAIVI